MKFRAQSRIFSKGVLKLHIGRGDTLSLWTFAVAFVGLLMQLYENKGLNLLALVIVYHLVASCNY